MRIKICGITSVDDATAAFSAGADAIGCVFHHASARAVSIEGAHEISRVVPAFGMMVGLFVDPTIEQVEAVLSSVSLHTLQFHGEEAPEFCSRFGRPYLKAIAMTDGVDLSIISEQYESASALLLDSAHNGQFGGTGHAFDWGLIDQTVSSRVVLAGGLNADNVRSAIEQVNPAGVDVSSGVEREKGIKDVAMMRAFVKAARG
ncbi:MAG: phosphoribosylanthranilate isomerase [Luminiphilus sp.]|nr:phosphoribosylanthranilate isomerase [Luminiphilus sp.]